MDLKVYKLIAKSDLYKVNYVIRATSLQDACKQAKVKFSKSFKVFGDDVKVGLNTDDIKNHIDEIFGKLYNS